MVSSPTTIFFPVWFNFDSVLSPSPHKPPPECCLCRSVSAYVLALFCLCPCAAVGPDHSLTGFGIGVLSRAVVGCGDRSLPGLPRVPLLYSSVPFNCSCWLWGGRFWRREYQAPSTLQHSVNRGWTSEHQRRKGRQRVFRRILCWPVWPAQLSGSSPAAHWLAGLASSVWPVCRLYSASAK